MLQSAIIPLPNKTLQPSPAFKKEVFKSVLAVVGFMLVYVILFALSLCLVAAAIYGGFALIINVPKFITILIGGGMIGLGIMVFVFLVKFLFATPAADGEDRIEITEKDQPELVRFIRQVAHETNTLQPKKIFLTGDVNAAVFYNSSFWSMFLPVRKNLKIGLGLVNSVNVSEFKAVLAHEFGHFSQRSMKLGSYVYQVNKVIYDMLYNNTGYADTLRGWSNVHGVFALFGSLTVQIVKGIQWVLHQMYKVVNLRYMSLSRQMEFHADLVAATVSGGNNIVSALQRIEFSNACFDTALDVCGKVWQENKIVNNIYENHRTVLKHIAQLNRFALSDGLPVLDEKADDTLVNRVNFKNQWASHPTLQERKAHVEAFNLNAPVNTDPAWVLFAKPEAVKQQATKLLYKNLTVDADKRELDGTAFETVLAQQLHPFSLPEMYKGYYDDRQIELFEPADIINNTTADESLEELLTAETVAAPKRLQLLVQDIAILKAIEAKELDVSTFDFDGMKYSRRDAAAIARTLEEELQALQETVKMLDKKLFRFSYKNASVEKAGTLKQGYEQYFQHRNNADHFLEKADATLRLLQPIYAGHTMTIDEINAMITALKGTHEAELKRELQTWMAAGIFEQDSHLKERVLKFIASDYQYFSGTQFFEHELTELAELIRNSWNRIQTFLAENFKMLIELQASVTAPKHTVRT